MDDVKQSAEFFSLHTLQRRVGESRSREEHPYASVFDGLSSLRASPRRRRLRLLRRRAPRPAESG